MEINGTHYRLGHSTKAVQLRAVATRVRRIRVRVGTIDISEDGFVSKLPESTVDTMEVQRRSSTDSSIADWVEPLVHIRASDKLYLELRVTEEVMGESVLTRIQKVNFVVSHLIPTG